MNQEHILSLDSVFVNYKNRRLVGFGRRRVTCVVNGISFSLKRGEILGIVGESGSGKSTLIKAICRFIPIAKGRVYIDGVDVTKMSEKQFFPYRSKVQIIHQDFCDTFNPLMRVKDILAEPLRIHFPLLTAAEQFKRIAQLLEAVELDCSLIDRFPFQLSGGQRQRLSIARGLAVDPELLICDEILSACDLFFQKQILALLMELNRKKNIAILFISHNIAVVAHFCHNIIVMRDGRVCEFGDAKGVCLKPSHSYTKMLVNAVPHVEFYAK